MISPYERPSRSGAPSIEPYGISCGSPLAVGAVGEGDGCLEFERPPHKAAPEDGLGNVRLHAANELRVVRLVGELERQYRLKVCRKAVAGTGRARHRRREIQAEGLALLSDAFQHFEEFGQLGRGLVQVVDSQNPRRGRFVARFRQRGDGAALPSGRAVPQCSAGKQSGEIELFRKRLIPDPARRGDVITAAMVGNRTHHSLKLCAMRAGTSVLHGCAERLTFACQRYACYKRDRRLRFTVRVVRRAGKERLHQLRDTGAGAHISAAWLRQIRRVAGAEHVAAVALRHDFETPAEARVRVHLLRHNAAGLPRPGWVRR